MPSAGGLPQLIDAHYEALYRYAYRLSGSAADAEDLVQEAFTKALARLPQLREPDRARGWLFRILRNAYLHKLRVGDAEQLVRDTVAQMLEQRARFVADVEKGIASADRGDLIDHHDVVNRINRLFEP